MRAPGPWPPTPDAAVTRSPLSLSARSLFSLLSLCLLPLVGCGDKGDDDDDDDDNGDDGGANDADGDGFDADDDCDDDDPGVNPGATEICDEIDNNCDGFVDEGLTDSFWADADEDGHGDAAAEVEACDAPEGTVSNSDDCDDNESRANPSATEACDGIDNDCDGLIDDADDDVDPATAEYWFADEDADGYGDAANSVVACEPPSGTVYDDNDCDDADADQFPGADEVCNGEDDNCDGDVDEDEATDAGTWYADADEDGYGDATVARIACNMPDGYVADTTDCDDGDDTQHPGADEVCNGEDDDCEGDIDEDDAVDATTWYTDTDEDGFGDATTGVVACDAPSGTVDDDTDCDDTSALINPDATEACNGTDDDCDPTTGEDGMVSYQDSTGLFDITSLFTGTAGSPVWLSSTADSTIWFCDGTYYAYFDVDADTIFASLSGDAADVTIDAEGDSSIFDIDTDGVTLTIDGLTLEDGSGDGAVGGYSNTGGIVNCEATTTASTVNISNSTMTGGTGSLGGAIATELCDVDLDTVDISDCEADDAGGGVFVLYGDLDISDSTITDNIAEAGGAIYHYDGTATLSDADISGNTADYFGSLYAGYSDVTCIGSASTAGGFTDNVDATYAAIVLDSGSSLDATLCDFGTSSGSDDNDPIDIMTSTFFEYRFGDDRTVSCDDETCGSSTSDTGGDTTDDFGGISRLRGNIEVVTGTPTIDSFESYLTVTPDSGSTCTLYWYLLTASSTSGPWTVAWDDSTTASSGTGFFDSGDIGKVLEDGDYVMFATAWGSTCDVDYYRGATGSFGFSSSHYGYGSDSGFLTSDYTSATTTAPSAYSSSSVYYQTVTWTE
jgi:hypothetical protein